MKCSSTLTRVLAKVILLTEEILDYSVLSGPKPATAEEAAAAEQERLARPLKPLSQHFNTFQGIYLNMHCVRDIILFYEERTMCSCLDAIKAMFSISYRIL
jgi:hypothetical protein